MSKKLRVEENTRLVESGRLSVPYGADFATFLRYPKSKENPVFQTLNAI